MANRTVKDAISVRGTNPQYLIEKIIRSRIYDSKYWKEECFALSAELIVDRAMELRYIGGVYGGNIKPTPFLCLILKLLQIQPSKDIVIEFIRQEDFKYVRALGALYLRLTGSALDCYKYLEPLYNDYKKLRVQNKMGKFEVLHMDEFIDNLFREERVCDIILPRIQARHVLEDTNQLEPLKSALEDDLDLEESEEEEPAPPPPSSEKHSTRRAEEDKSSKHKHHRHRERGASRSPPPSSKRRGRSRERERAEREHHYSARNDYYSREANDYYPSRDNIRDDMRESEYFAPRDRSDRERHKKRSEHGEKRKKRKRSHSRSPPPPSRYY